ncbi:MAG: hypothetical protein ACYTBJ_25705 [Planctomycetota bacterium]
MYDETTYEYTTYEYVDLGCYHDWESVGPKHYPDLLFPEIAKREGFKKVCIEGNDSWWKSKTEPGLLLQDEKAEWIESQIQRVQHAKHIYENNQRRKQKAERLYEEATRGMV